MAIDPAGFCKVKFVFSDAVGEIYPGMEALVTGAPTLSDLDDAAAAIGDAWVTHLHTLTSPQWTLANVWLIYSDGSTELKGTATVGDAGTLGSTVTTPRSACLVSGYQIEDYYRGGKPRTYWPGPGRYESGSTTHWQAALCGDYETGLQALIDEVDAYSGGGVATLTLGCIRRRALGSPLTPPQFFAYTGSHVDTRIGTQRNRLGRV